MNNFKKYLLNHLLIKRLVSLNIPIIEMFTIISTIKWLNRCQLNQKLTRSSKIYK